MNIKEINSNIDKLELQDGDFAKVNCLNKGVEFFQVLGYNAIAQEIKDGKQSISNTCKYLLSLKYQDEKQSLLIKAMLKISLKCNL